MIPDQAFELFDRVLAVLEGEAHSGWSAPAKSALLVELTAARDRLEALIVRTAGEWDADRSWEADGARSAASWMSAHAPMSKRDAQKLVRTARLAQRHERVGTALAAGELSPAHAEVLAKATRGRAALLERDVDTLIDIAGTLNVDDYATALAHWRSLADDEMARDDAALAFHERSVAWTSTLDGRVELWASLDAEGGATVVKALEAYDRPDRSPEAAGPVDGPRTVEQRMADGLVQLCSESLQGRERAGHHTPAVDGLVDVELLGNMDRDVDGHDGAPMAPYGQPPDWLRHRCELRGIGPIARDAMVRLACDAAVGRVVMRGESEVLDLGRRTRVVNRALRRAIELRDRGCAFPACDAPLHWCDVHHLVHWAQGGETNLENCLLLCRRHHVLVHEGGWELARGPDGEVVVAVRGARPRARRRGPPRSYALAA